MKERPILFSGSMVRAILADQKTQTRRVVKLTDGGHVKEPRGHRRWHPEDPNAALACPHGVPGDRLWVRETWAVNKTFDRYKPLDLPETFVYLKVCQVGDVLARGKWRPSIFMRRWMSRINLEVISVRVERVQDITEADAVAEGITANEHGSYDAWLPKQETHCDFDPDPRYAFECLWDDINGKRNEGRYSWEKNPWVWVVEFKPIDPG